MRNSSSAARATTVTEKAVQQNVLAAAFKHFNEASRRLEERYEELRQEAEGLRAELREKDLAIKRAEKLSTLGETAAAIAHEVRNPLGAMKLFLSLLKDDVADRPGARALVDEMNKCVTSLDNVVSNILQFSKSKKLEMSPINLHSIIQEQVSQVLPQTNSEVNIALELTGNPFIIGNEHSLRQVFHNLFLNGLQAMHWKGRLEIKSSEDSDGFFKVTVHDSGPGIDKAVTTKLFEPFVTTRHEGTGLGLAIVKQIVDGHNGQISVCNNGGALFSIRLPRKASN